MRNLTEEEYIQLVADGAAFWREFSELCEKYINKAPEDMKDYWTMYLGEKTSIYGRNK